MTIFSRPDDVPFSFLTRVDEGSCALSVSTDIKLGTPQSILLVARPWAAFVPKRCVFNSPAEKFIKLDQVGTSGLNFLQNTPIDTFVFRPSAWGFSLDALAVGPRRLLTIVGAYTGLVPAQHRANDMFKFTATFYGAPVASR